MPARNEARRWLITGCSSGLGKCLAEAALARGDRVMLTARSVDALADLASRYPATARALELDVCRPADIEGAARAALADFGGIDVLVNNAGTSVIGALEEVSKSEYRSLYETNLFGPIELMRAFIPQMRERRSGVIVSVSSVGGIVPTPGMAHYSATKCALEAISEGLKGELASFGVRVLIVEPAGFRTHISQTVGYAAGMTDTYRESSGQWRQRMQEFGGKEPGDPVRAASAIIRAVDDPAAPLRLPLGAIAPALMMSHLQGVLGNIAELSAVAANCDFPR
jgi:short-subunit dehydrogenase